jgi:hypothetical protein
MPLAMDGQKDLVEMPFIADAWSAAAYLIGVILSELTAPFADRFIGDRDATRALWYFPGYRRIV